MSILSLLFGLAFISIAITVSYRQKIGLEKDLLVGTVRTFLQLFAIGYVLQFIFDMRSLVGVGTILCVMLYVASTNAAKRVTTLPKTKAALYLAAALLLSEMINLGLLLGLGIIPFEPQYVIPLSGMIIGNSMVAAGVTINRLQAELAAQKEQVIAALCLGASSGTAAQSAIRTSVKAGMSPTIDVMKTVGLVQLPGMMTGQIIAGMSPVEAVKYQIMIHLILASCAAFTSMIVAWLFYRSYFTQLHQLSPYYPHQGS